MSRNWEGYWLLEIMPWTRRKSPISNTVFICFLALFGVTSYGNWPAAAASPGAVLVSAVSVFVPLVPITLVAQTPGSLPLSPPVSVISVPVPVSFSLLSLPAAAPVPPTSVSVIVTTASVTVIVPPSITVSLSLHFLSTTGKKINTRIISHNMNTWVCGYSFEHYDPSKTNKF